MTTRERTMSGIIFAFILVAGTGFVGYYFILSPLQAREAQINNLQSDIDKRTAALLVLHKRKPDLERWKKTSLPIDVDHAGLEYGRALTDALKASGFDVTMVSPRAADAKSVPMYAVTKKPVYTKLQFQAAVKGDLATLVDFLERFYKLPLLHQIRNLTVTKPTSSASSRGNQFNQSPSENLDIVMTVEALVLDTAEKRSTLLPDLKPEEVPPALTPARQYAAIAGKNMFYGPTRFRTETIRSVDVRPYVKLVSITGFGDNRIVTLHDIYHNYEYEIEPRSLGGFRVTATYPLNGRKLAPPGMRNGRDLELIDPQDENNTWRFQIVKIGEHEVILRTTDEQNKQYYRLRTGDTLFDAMTTPMSRSELNALDIKEPTAPAAADDKKDGDAKEE